jgi:hypothetical protein
MESTVKKDIKRILTAVPGFFICLFFVLARPSTHYVVVSFGIGDAMLSCMYLPAYKEAKNLRHVTVIGKKRMRELYDAFSDSCDARILLGDGMLIMISNALRFDPGYYIFCEWTKRVTLAHESGFMRHYLLKRAATLKMPDLYRSGVFGLFPDAPRAVPKLPAVDIAPLAAQYGLIKGKTVILSPFANSLGSLPFELFEALAAMLAEKGYLCVTNLGAGNESPVSGTVGIRCGLADAVALAGHCGFVLGIRSGFLDFVSLARCRVVALYPEDCLVCEHYGMAEWGLPAETKELQFRGDVRDTVNAVAELFETGIKKDTGRESK